MGSYITGILVAAAVVSGLYYAVENHSQTTSRAPLRQEDVSGNSPEELRELAKDYTAKGHVEAILELGKRPGELEKTVPLLTKLLHSRDEIPKFAAKAALQEIGEPAVEHLKPLFESDLPQDIRLASLAINALGPVCDDYVDNVNEWLRSDSILIQRCGCYALQNMGREASLECMEGLIECLEIGNDFNVQCMACRAIEKIGDDALDAEEALLTLLENGNVSARGWAAICLGALGPTSDTDIATVLHERLKKAQLAIDKQRLMIGLAHLGPEAAAAADTVQEIAENHVDSSVRAHAAFALWKLTGEKSDALVNLKALLANDEIAMEAIELIGRMGDGGADLADELANKLRSENAGIREAAVVSLGNIGRAAKHTESSVKKLLKDSDPLVRYAAKITLAEFAKPEEEEGSKNKKRNKKSAEDKDKKSDEGK